MKKNFAINAAKQILNTPVSAISAKSESTTYLALADREKEKPGDPVCCPWLAYFLKPQHEEALTLAI
ncbi:hypothetical protein [Tellurirhabdus rosea]|uniref:hypothetical protein n=1 Tax=Tellurirhabdus rosea TaxID=2674997 RepID=UPI0022573B1E|nr:hypothetical protein [Tellurirhabdus rosea]